MSRDQLVAALPEAHRRHLDPQAPAAAKMMAARGLLPLPPRELVIVVCGLSLDDDEKVAAAAVAGLQKMPDKVLLPVLQGEIPPAVLTVLAPQLLDRDAVLQGILLNPVVQDGTVAAVAAGASAAIAELIASNQERLLRSEAVVRALATNPHISKAVSDRMFDFLVRSGVLYDDLDGCAEAMTRLTAADLAHVAEKVPLPAEVQSMLAVDPRAVGGAPAGALIDTVMAGGGGAATAGAAEAPPGAHPETEAGAAGGAAGGTDEGAGDDGAMGPESLRKILARLSTSQKVALALRGNREARSVLVRDSNRVIATAAIRSPMITEQEVVSAAQSRSIHEEVLRIIAGSKELHRAYAVKLSLVNNPKTPPQTAMRFMSILRQSDLRQLARSKNVSAAVAARAKKMLQNKAGMQR